jgi:serine acetyltransferase
VIYETPSRLTKLIYFLNIRNCLFLSPIRRILHLILHLEIRKEYFINNLQLIHPYNIIIHPESVLGKDITIFNNVTIGSIDKDKKPNTPVIGDNVIVYPYVVIAGKINIGNNCIIQAGSIVLSSIPANHLVAGNPAKIIKKLT